jgi:signal transduction histidine kinase
MWSLVHPEHREFVKQRAAARLAGALTPPRYEFCIVRKSGETRWLDFSATVIEFGGRPAILATALDVTERKQAEAALRVSEKLAATGRLAATIAHEINNPLASVTNVLYLLGQHATLDARGLDYVRLAQEELARIVQITRQMLAFYREAAAPVEVRVTDVVDNVLELYHRRIANTGLKLRKEYYTDTSVPGFPGELRQVFSNLVVNAIDAAGEDGRLRIRVRAGRDWARPERRGVRVTVADSGPGIAPANRKRIFEPFFTTKGEKGTGLGLWVTHGIVHKHDGSIRMYSSTHPAHRGTVFSVFLPQRAVSLPRPGWQVPAEAPADSVA